jgi:hypothetical protein
MSTIPSYNEIDQITLLETDLAQDYNVNASYNEMDQITLLETDLAQDYNVNPGN